MMNPPRRGTPDFILLFLTVALVGFGVVMVFSASYSLTYSDDPLSHTKRQIMYVALGLFIMFFMMNTSYALLRKLFVPFFLVTLTLLVAVLIFGKEVNGSKSWFRIGEFGGQPTEFAKIGIMLYLGFIITKKDEKFRDFKTGLLPALVVTGFVGFLIMLQPDLGSCMILILSAAIVLFVGGARFKHLFLLFVSSVAVIGLTIAAELLRNEHSYRIKRFTSYLDPWKDYYGDGYQLIQSLFALGHGGATGAGFGQSIQKLHYLPEAHNDFIFAVIGEELGFVGAAIFLLVYVLFLWRALIIVLRCGDTAGMLAGTGIVATIALQALINIGGVTGAIPITGVTLPLISYGGSSLLSSMMAIGLLLSISREFNKEDKEKTKSSKPVRVQVERQL